METDRQKFHANPTIDPVTNQPVVINSKEYKRLIKKYGKVKVRSPKSQRMITVGNSTYKQLLRAGYTQEELLNLSIATPTLAEVPLPEDIWRTILLNVNHRDMKHTCYINTMTSHICSQKTFWIQKFTQDGLPLMFKTTPTSISNWIKTYESIAYLVKHKFKGDDWEEWEDDLFDYTFEKKFVKILKAYMVLDPNIINRFIFRQ